MRSIPLPILAAVLAALLGLPRPAARAGEAPSFTNDVLPVLTRHGCNAGGCHGKLAGQNGFRLSLRGYAPEADHAALATEEYGRRIGGLDPATSLLLAKATGELPHGGGSSTGSSSGRSSPTSGRSGSPTCSRTARSAITTSAA